jgi:transcriptional regulator with XRE-family HTH domain
MNESGHDPQARALARRFGENLILARGRADRGQIETAQRAGLHRSQISMLERGLRVPRLDTIVKIAGAVEIMPCELLTGMAWLGQSGRQIGGGTYGDGGRR